MTMKNNQIYKSANLQKGTTIIELLIYLALLTIFLTVLLDIFVTTLNFKLQTESTSALNQDTRYILGKLSYDIYNADNVSVPANFGDTSLSLTLTTAGVPETFAVSGGNMVLTTGGTSMNLNGKDTNIQSVSFKRLGDSSGKPTFQINLTLVSQITTKGGTNNTQTVQTTVGLR